MPLPRDTRPSIFEVYGLRLKSAIRLPCQTLERAGGGEVEVTKGSASVFSRVYRAIEVKPDTTHWFQHARLPEGSDYLRWAGLFEFLIAADGRSIACRSLDGVGHEAFQTYLLGQVLSFALLKRRVEPLHATAVLINEEAVAFLGDCGYGKSSLGAAFLQAGYPLLTDDLLALKESSKGFSAYPGLPRIKLFPEIAQTLLPGHTNGTPMNNLTPKLIVPLDRRQFCQVPARLKAIYVLTPPRRASRRQQITIKPLSVQAAFVELLRNTFNPVILEPERLECQFHLATELARKIPVKSLSYPRSLARLPAVRESVRADLAP